MIFCFLLGLFVPINLPENINGWKKTDFKNYNKENIFDYINGAGEVYISYDFQNLMVYSYKKGKKEIVVDIFEMKEPKYAYGLFTHIRGNGEYIHSLGYGAEISESYLIFWKGKYFVSISFFDGGEREEIFYFGREVSRVLKEEKKDFEILKIVEGKKIDLKNIKYFFNMNILNYYYYITNEDIFFFKNGTEGIYAPLKNGSIIFLLFRNEKNAKKGLENLSKKFYGGNYEMKETEKGKWSSYIFKENLILIFLDFPSKEILIEAINENR